MKFMYELNEKNKNIIEEIKKEIKKNIAKNSKKLFSCNSKFFNKTIIIIDIEWCGTSENEVIELCGLKINSGKFLDLYYKQFKAKNIEKKHILKNLLFTKKHYDMQKTIYENIEEIDLFFSDCDHLLFFDCRNDIIILENIFMKFSISKKNLLYQKIDIQNIIMEINSSLNRPSLKSEIEKIESKKIFKTKKYNALYDVYQILLLVLKYNYKL